MPRFEVAKKIWLKKTIEASDRKQACKTFEISHGRPDVLHDSEGNDHEVIGRCEVCGLVIFEDEEICLGYDNGMFCQKCFEEETAGRS